MNWEGIIRTYKEALEILKNIMLKRSFDDKEKMLIIVRKLILALSKVQNNDLISFMFKRGLRLQEGKETKLSLPNNLILKTLQQVERDLYYNPEGFAGELKNILLKILSSKFITFCSISNGEGIEKCEKEFFTNILPEIKKVRLKNQNAICKSKQGKKPKPTAKIPSTKREALVTYDSLQFNGMVAKYPKGMEYDVKLYILQEIIRDKYLLNNMRNALGIYLYDIVFFNKGMNMFSGSDPNITKTWAVMENLKNWLEKFEISQEELDKYKVKVYCKILSKILSDMPDIEAVNRKILGINNDIVEDLNKIKNMSLAELKAIINKVKDMLSNAYYFTIGNREKVMAEKDSFDNIMEF